jgi:hypothetical protein
MLGAGRHARLQLGPAQQQAGCPRHAAVGRAAPYHRSLNEKWLLDAPARQHSSAPCSHGSRHTVIARWSGPPATVNRGQLPPIGRTWTGTTGAVPMKKEDRLDRVAQCPCLVGREGWCCLGLCCLQVLPWGAIAEPNSVPAVAHRQAAPPGIAPPRLCRLSSPAKSA